MKQAAWPKITVITPSFNQGEFIEQTIQSVLSQKYPNLEFLVFDGGSTDNTSEILKKYSSQIIWESKKDKGQTDAINNGIKKSTGEILCFLNSDDLFTRNALKKVASHFMKNSQISWLSGDYQIIDAKNRIIQKPIRTYKHLLRLTKSRSIFSIANFIAQPSTFWKKSLIKQVGLLDINLRYCMDYDLWFRFWEISRPFFVSDNLSLFRIHRSSKGVSQFVQQFEEEESILSNYTDSKVIKSLHHLHNKCILLIYKLIK